MFRRFFQRKPFAGDDDSLSRSRYAEAIGLRPRVVIITLACLIAIGVVTWRMVFLGQQRVIEHQAIEVAEVVARAAASARSVYAAEIVEKLRRDGFGAHTESEKNPGYVPLPAQFLKMFGKRVSEENGGLFSYKPVSKWNLEPTQGLTDDFLRWAWPQLEEQDREAPTAPIVWKPIWRIEELSDVKTLRYLRADPASANSCVACHNKQETITNIRKRRTIDGVAPGKQWRLHQLLGAIEVNIPLDKVEVFASAQNRVTLAVIIGVIIAGVVVLGFLVALDVMRSRRMARELSWQANHDSLTELASRGAFEQRAQELLNRARTETSVHALLFMDLDQFKVVNDTCGHSAGDQLLRELSAVLKTQIRANDLLARLGGDEFGALLEACPPAKALEIAEKLRATVQDFWFMWQNRNYAIGISIGLVQITATTDSVAAIMSQADLACYAAKDGGRNRIHVFSSTDAEINQRRSEMEWISRITNALEQGRISLAEQEARSLVTTTPPKLYREMLLRMVDEENKSVSTTTLISAAERYNFMPTIDRWVVKTVLEAIAHGRLPVGEHEIVAINLSGTSLNDEKFLDFIRAQIRQLPGDMPQHVCFEITETAAVNSISKARAFIETVRAMGCKFALDDFGSGLSSMMYIKNFPVDFLKIEGSFVRDLLTDPVDRAMVEAVCHIGKAIGATLIAEWVESEELMAQVKTLGIDYAQGYAVSRPKSLRLLAPDGGLRVTLRDIPATS